MQIIKRSTVLHRRSHLTSGFTLVEIITVLAIIVITALFVAPEILSWGGNMRVGAAGRDLFAEMNLAKVAAIEHNNDVIVNVDADNHNYLIFIDDGSGVGGVANNAVRDGSEQILSGDHANPVQLNAGDFKDVIFEKAKTMGGIVGFTPRGMPVGNNVGFIVLRTTDQNRWYRVEIKSSGSLQLTMSTDKDGADGTWH